MDKDKTQQVLVDTCFLINLYNKESNYHETAVKYHKYFLSKEIRMRLSTIVVSEFQQKQSVVGLVTSGKYVMLPFNYDDAIATAEIAFNLGSGIRSDTSNKAEYKDDHKIMGQAKAQGIDYIITADESTLAKYCTKLSDARLFSTKVIPLDAGYDESTFNGGQTSLIDSVQE